MGVVAVLRSRLLVDVDILDIIHCERQPLLLRSDISLGKERGEMNSSHRDNKGVLLD